MTTELATELHHASQLDPGLVAVIDPIGIPPPRIRPRGFATLARIINSQQLSTRAAAAIWQRLEDECHPPVTPKKILARRDIQLRAVGLSRQKITYLRGLAHQLDTGALDLAALDDLADDAAIASLVQLPGVGRWSAEIYLLFALARPDIFPAGDLALRRAVQHYNHHPDCPTATEVATFSHRWSPHRSAVAILFWQWYQVLPAV